MALSSLYIETAPSSPAQGAGFIDPLMEKQAGTDGGTSSFRAKVRRFMNLCMLLVVGGLRGATLRMADKAAWGTLVFSGCSGTVGGVVNGVTLTFAHGASDQADSSTFVTNLNASTNALVQHLLKASNFAMTFTLATATAGSTVLLGGVTLKASAKATAPAGVWDEFPIGGTDTANAAALVTLIATHPLLRDRFVASSAVGVVTVRALYGAAEDPYTAVTGSGITRSGNFAATTTALVWSILKGTAGNQATLAASGTGVTASGARLTLGTLQTVITL